MTPTAKRAIGRLRAIRADGGQISGTAFVVADRYLLTAFHVIGDRAASLIGGQPVCYPQLWFEPTVDDCAEIPVTVVVGACDARADWALLEAKGPMTGVGRLPLGEVSQREVNRRRVRSRLEFESWGFPTLARMSGSGITITGWLQDRDAEYQDAWAYQLFSENAAAALGDPLNGLSGAPCIIDGAAVGIIRSNLIVPKNGGVAPNHIVGGILYACPLGAETLQERCAAYLPSLDPIRGLPGLAHQDLPTEPFRYLRWYGAEHAEVFFGRNRKLRDLYFQVTDPESPAVVLMYGASGVGKSSVLEAGLVPRLSWDWEIRVRRREAGKTLIQSLDDELRSISKPSEASGKPIIIALDQVEEVFTDSKVDGNAELTALGKQLRAATAHQNRKLRIILGFRSEWLANIRERLKEVELSFSEFYLERLTGAEVEEIVRGVSSTERLQKFYGVEVDEDLPRRIADDLLADPTSPVSPVLSIILTRLWEEAKKHRAGGQKLSGSVYDERMRNKLDLDRFLIDQINAVAAKRSDDVTSGLVIDLLYRHTTEHGTAAELSWPELCKMYYQLAQEGDHSYLRGLVAHLSAQSLLYSGERTELGRATEEAPGNGQITRLAHDTLAPPVRKNFQQSDRAGQRAERRLMSWLDAWDPSSPEQGTLDAAGLALIEHGARGMRGLSETESNFLQTSQTANRLARRRVVRQRAQQVIGSMVLTAVLGGLGWFAQPWLKEQMYRLRHSQVLATVQERQLAPQASFKECTHCPEMVIIPNGKFMMGGPPDRAGEPREYPRHEVTIAQPFAVSRFELTFDEWDACVAYGDCSANISSGDWSRGPQPAIHIRWSDAQTYVAWLSRVTGRRYRLLTEAEWEYAARANTTTHFYSGNDDAKLKEYAWYSADDSFERRPHPGGEKKPNSFGLHEMHGNVREWVQDCYREGYRGAPQDGSEWRSESCARRVVRGGSWLYQSRMLRSSHREQVGADDHFEDLGLRVARELVR